MNVTSTRATVAATLDSSLLLQTLILEHQWGKFDLLTFNERNQVMEGTTTSVNLSL